MSTSPTAVAVLGLGAMGSRMAKRMVEAGYDVTVWNRSRAAADQLVTEVSVKSADTAAEATGAVQVALSMLADDEVCRDVWLNPDNGALAAMAPGSVLIEASTVSPSFSVELEAASKAAGVHMLEAPVVGSRPQADAGELFVLVGGDEQVLASVEPLISSYAGGVRSVGSIGNAASMKLAINGLFGIQVAAYAEVVGLLERSGVDTDDALGILAALPITSPGLQRILGLIEDRAFEPNFPISLVAKDLRYLESLARELDVENPLVTAASAVYATAAEGPSSGLDISGVASRYVES